MEKCIIIYMTLAVFHVHSFTIALMTLEQHASKVAYLDF